MKKLLALMLAAALALSLVACGGGSGAGDNNSTNTPNGGGEDSTTTNELTADQCIGTWKLNDEETEVSFAGIKTMELSKGGVGKGRGTYTSENSYNPLVWEISEGILKVSTQDNLYIAAFEVTDNTMVATDGSCLYDKES